jgi:hypothetical protein
MSFLRWIPTFLAFPLAGLSAMLLFGPLTNALVGLGGGLLAGAIIGGAQWLALGSRAGWRWFVGTSVAMAAGLALSVLIVGPPTAPPSAIVTGLLTGAIVGGVQGLVLGSRSGAIAKTAGVTAGVIWTGGVSAAWGLGWLVTSAVIVDIDRGHVVFGASGALLATVITGVALRLILGPRPARVEPTATVAAPVDVDTTVGGRS